MSDRTTIPVKVDTRDRIYYSKRPAETYDDFLNRLMESDEPERREG